MHSHSYPTIHIIMIISYLLLAGMVKRVHLLDGEEARGDKLPNLTPVLTVGSKGNGRRPVQEVVQDLGRRPRGEDVVACVRRTACAACGE